MAKALVIVESPAKAKTINKYLGKQYVVKASLGHIKDLPKRELAVDVEHGFEPKYVASTEWHEGKTETKRYHSAHSHLVKKIRPENLIFFESEQAAEAAGFRPGHFAEEKEHE